MKTLLRLSLFLVIIFVSSTCGVFRKNQGSDTIILPLSDTIQVTEGSIVYALPRTVFTIIVEMERTIEIPGPYARFAGDMLGLSNVIQSESEYWAIKAVSVNSHDELDPSEYYVIESTTLFQTNVLSLKKEGLILDLNPGFFFTEKQRPDFKESGMSRFRLSDLGSDEYFVTQKDTAYKRVKVDSAFIRIPYLVEKKKKLPVDQLAERAARRLLELREGKYLILTGEANVFPQSEAPINEINRLEQEYTELFTGKTFKETRFLSYDFIPEKGLSGKPVVLANFSLQAGLAKVQVKGAVPLSITLNPEKKNKDLTFIGKPKSAKDKPVFDLLFYRVPEVVNIRINLGQDLLLNTRRLIYQYGEVIKLPANYIIGK